MEERSQSAKRTAEICYGSASAASDFAILANGRATQAVLYLSPASQALDDLLTLYPALKCWAIVGRPLCGLY